MGGVDLQAQGPLPPCHLIPPSFLFSAAGPQPLPRMGQACCVLGRERVLLQGGLGEANPGQDFYFYLLKKK